MKLKHLKKNYLKVPNKIFKMNLSASELGLYIFLLSLAETFHPSKFFLAGYFKVSRPTIIKWMQQLETCGIIYCMSKGRLHVRAQYEFRPQTEWTPKKNEV